MDEKMREGSCRDSEILLIEAMQHRVEYPQGKW